MVGQVSDGVPETAKAVLGLIGKLPSALGGYQSTLAMVALSAQIVETLRKASDEAAEQSKMLNESAQQKIDVEALNRTTLTRVQQGMESGAAANTYRS
ncbi:hypothetical protein Val02_58870 [Virgisporangium aliadipatigenens]|uniref:Uncharacterized protein n=1 Tax=Virgisporangium aliadipatigenens TaxID=741659 RepID=A0A8J4DT94_9ACTN|nr:hypothetical protein Val02_58870 [Virgisporangium aliadipatigenens]